MGNITITNVDLGPVQLGNNRYGDDELLLGASAHAFLAGTILGRQTVSSTITVGAITGTGTHVLTAAATAGKTPKVGAHTLRASTLSSGVGPWTLTDPDGKTQTITTVSKTAVMSFADLGVDITPAAAGTDFVTNDYCTVTTAALSSANQKLVAFSPTGSNGAEKPLAVLNDAAAVATGGTQVPVRAIISGDVNATRLVIDADGNGSNITKAILDQLRHFGINPIPVQQTAGLDNQ